MKFIKKCVAVFLCFVLLFASSFNINADTGISLSLDTDEITAGDYITLTVTFTAESNMNAFYYELMYDTADLQFVSSSAETINSSAAGTVIYLADANSASVAETYVFRCKKLTYTTVTVTNALCADTAEYEYNDASLSFIVERATTGDVNNDTVVDTSDLALLKLYLAGVDAQINNEYSDINGDNEINTSDLALLKLYLAGA